MRQLKFGVEIEFFGITYNAAIEAVRAAGLKVKDYNGYSHIDSANEWKVTYDSSVTCESTGTCFGLELVSPILIGDEGLDDLAKAAKALKEAGAKVDKTCGLHVHHNASDLSAVQIKNILCTYYKYQRGINTVLPKSRKTSGYCKRLSKYTMGKLKEYFESGNDETQTMYEVDSATRHDRYLVVNVMAYRRHETVEFRQHSGTIDSEKIEAWVLLTFQIVQYAATHDVPVAAGPTSTLPQLLKVLNLNDTWLETYYLNRAEQLR